MKSSVTLICYLACMSFGALKRMEQFCNTFMGTKTHTSQVTKYELHLTSY